MKQTFIILFFLANSFFTLAYASDNTYLDSLVFQNSKTDEKVTVASGMKLEITTKEKEKLNGVFKQASNDSLFLNEGNQEVKVALKDIKNFIVFFKPNKPNPVKALFQATANFVASSSIGVGGASIVIGAATLSTNTVLGVGLIAVGVPLIYYGYRKSAKLKRIYQRKIKLDKGWEVSIN